jgi:hypothetical protein
MKEDNKIVAYAVGEIGNYYGGLYIAQYDNKYYWIIENYDTSFKNINEWDEIGEGLYDMLFDYSTGKKDDE